MGGFQRTARATCPGGISRTRRTAMRTISATRRVLNFFLEATGRHSREPLPVEKPVDGRQASISPPHNPQKAPEHFARAPFPPRGCGANPVLSAVASAAKRKANRKNRRVVNRGREVTDRSIDRSVVIPMMRPIVTPVASAAVAIAAVVVVSFSSGFRRGREQGERAYDRRYPNC
jgi:hypothetical protein